MTVHSEVLSEEGCACAEAPGRLDAKSLLEPHFTALAVSCDSTRDSTRDGAVRPCVPSAIRTRIYGVA